MKAIFNLRRAAMEFCKSEEIFLIVDGDDELLGKQVLKIFRSFFHKDEVWFVYSDFLLSDNLEKVIRFHFERVSEGNKYRSYRIVTRAFYTNFFRNIRDEDLRGEDGQYFRAANDVAIFYSLLGAVSRKSQIYSRVDLSI